MAKEAKQLICVRIDPQDYDRLEAIAKATATPGETHNTSLVVREAIRQYLATWQTVPASKSAA